MNNTIKKFSLWLVAVVLSLNSLMLPVYAQETDKLFQSNNDIFWFDPNATDLCTSPGNSTTALVGNDNAEKIYRYFLSKGLSGAQAAGFLGNMKKESGHNPFAKEPSLIAAKNEMPTPNRGFGLIQWTFPDRQQPLVDLAKSTQRDTTDLTLQLDYVWQELNGAWKPTLDKLKTINDPVEAAIWIEETYEISADTPATVLRDRGEPAKAYHEQYKHLDKSSSSDASEGGDSGVLCGASGGIGDYMSEQFKLYNQCDSPWGQMRVPSPNGTACQVSCGPTSMAMVIQNMTGKTVTPTDTINFTSANNMWVGTSGTSLETNIRIAQEYDVRGEMMDNARDVNEIREVLNDGGMVMVAGLGGQPFLAGVYHYVIIRGVTKDGKFRIADPNGKSGDYEINPFLGNVRDGIAFYKE